MSVKTPVSMLQEEAVKFGFTPTYELVQEKCGTHVNEFTFKVSGFDKVSFGKGSSKKEAKQNAALALLMLITNLSDKSNFNLPETYHENKSMMSENCPEDLNYVGKLQETCSLHGFSSPVYVNVEECGPAHLKKFTVKCRVGHIEYQAIGATKKQAKQLAAQKVLSTFDTENDFRDLTPAIKYLTLDSEELNRKAITAVSKTKSKLKRDIPGIGNLVHSFKKTYATLLLDSEVSFLKIGKIENPISLSKSMCKRLDITISEILLPTTKKDKCLLYLDFKSNKVDHDCFHWGFVGTGQDLMSCQLNAYHRWISFVRFLSL